MLEMQGIPKVLLENTKLIFQRQQYVLDTDKNGAVINRIWLFPLFTKSWAGLNPFDRIEDEDIDVTALEERVKRSLAEDNEQLTGFGFLETYWDVNPDAYVYYGFFDKNKRMATRMEAYTTPIKGTTAWQVFLDFQKVHMFDEPFDSVSEELQNIALKLIGMD